MILYLVLAMFCLLFYYFIPRVAQVPAFLNENRMQSYQGRKFYCIVIAAVLIAVMGLRGWTVGTDTINYANNYYNAAYSYQDLWTIFLNRFGLEFWSQRGDLGYFLIISLFRGLGLHFNAFLTCCAALIVIPTAILIYRYSDHMGLGFFWFIVLIMGPSMCALRSSMAWGLLILAFLEMQKGRQVRFWLCVVCAALIHITGIVFVIYYFIRKIKGTPIIMIVTMFLSIVMFFVNASIGEFINRYSYWQYSPIILRDANLKLFVFISITALIVAFIIRNRKDIVLEKFSMMLPAILIIFWIGSTGAISRLFFCFLSFTVIVIPNMLASIKNPYTRLLGHSFYFITGLYLIYSGFSVTTKLVPYVFFWQ